MVISSDKEGNLWLCRYYTLITSSDDIYIKNGVGVTWHYLASRWRHMVSRGIMLASRWRHVIPLKPTYIEYLRYIQDLAEEDGRRLIFSAKLKRNPAGILGAPK